MAPAILAHGAPPWNLSLASASSAGKHRSTTHSSTHSCPRIQQPSAISGRAGLRPVACQQGSQHRSRGLGAPRGSIPIRNEAQENGAAFAPPAELSPHPAAPGLNSASRRIPSRKLALEDWTLPRAGPGEDDVTEVETFCRLYRLTQQLRVAAIDFLRATGRRKQDLLNGPSASELSAGDESDAEERVVARLALMATRVQEVRPEVLGRAAGAAAGPGPLRLPQPKSAQLQVVVLRADLRLACSQLEDALYEMAPEGGEEVLLLHAAALRCLARLRNCCLDVGLPRPDGAPCHADIPNFTAVRLQLARAAGQGSPGGSEDGKGGKAAASTRVWVGGQYTEEGLQWLVDHGVKTIVDLRTEGEAGQWPAPSLKECEGGGRVLWISLPVSAAGPPDPAQVEQFGSLLSQPANYPVYVHSKAGLGRTHGMIDQLRRFPLGSKGQPALGVSTPKPSSSRDVAIAATDGQAAGLRESSVQDGARPTLPSEPRVKQPTAPGAGVSGGESTEAEENTGTEKAAADEEAKPCQSAQAAESTVEAAEGTEASANEDDKRDDHEGEPGNREERQGAEGELPERSRPVKGPPAGSIFELQRPGLDVLSRKATFGFRAGSKAKGAAAGTFGPQGWGLATTAKRAAAADVAAGTIAGPAGIWARASPGIPRAGAAAPSAKPHSRQPEAPGAVPPGASSTRSSSASAPDSAIGKPLEADKGGRDSIGGAQAEAVRSESGASPSGSQDGREGTSAEEPQVEARRAPSQQGSQNGTYTTRDEPEEVAELQGDMCASTTGVVRLQSRRKAEMYLVRTDGFSCTREKVKESTLAFTHPSTQQQMLMWKTPPKTVLLLKKLGDELMEEAQKVAVWLHQNEGMAVVVEPELHDRFARLPGFGFVQTYYNQDTSKLHERVDFVVCLGGDGVILHASNLFRTAVPPVVSFNLGSLGFLTAHPFDEFKEDLKRIIHGNSSMDGVYITLRMRLRCELFRNGKPLPGKVFEVLNEVVVDRGSNPYLSKIECYERNRLITKVQADGVLVATPTGSTAYSTAAGGSMVHPNVPCMLFTPICPHSLSFRPVILPDSALFELKVPADARNNAWVSFDGKKRQQLSKGDSVRVQMSEHPLPTVNKSDQTDDWFRSLVRCLNWNERMEQKALATTS